MMGALPLNITQNMPCEVGLAQLPDKIVQTCVTSPPYYALRDYGIAPSKWPEIKYSLFGFEMVVPAMECCLGLEETPHAFVGHLLHIFRQVHRVLRDDGTCWVNLGDSYATNSGGYENATTNLSGSKERRKEKTLKRASICGMKQKDMVGIPWMFAFAMREDGWYLRQDIIWHKPNPMPESVTDRCTKAHEYIFLFSKSQKYFFDHVAIKVPGKEVDEPEHKVKASQSFKRKNSKRSKPIVFQSYGTHRPNRKDPILDGMANKRSVWTVSAKPFKEAHFATFPQDLIVDCIKAGTPEYGCCAACRAPYKRMIDKKLVPTSKASFNSKADQRDHLADKQDQGSNRSKDGHKPGWIYNIQTKGWQPSCQCNDSDKPKASIVLDPFHGSGTTGLVSRKLGVDFIAYEANPAYVQIEDKRKHHELGMFA